MDLQKFLTRKRLFKAYCLVFLQSYFLGLFLLICTAPLIERSSSLFGSTVLDAVSNILMLPFQALIMSLFLGVLLLPYSFLLYLPVFVIGFFVFSSFISYRLSNIFLWVLAGGVIAWLWQYFCYTYGGVDEKDFSWLILEPAAVGGVVMSGLLWRYVYVVTPREMEELQDAIKEDEAATTEV